VNTGLARSGVGSPSWGKFGEWAASLKKGALVEVASELRYREFQPKGFDSNVRIVEIHASSILSLDRAEKAESRNTRNQRNRRINNLRVFNAY
jgi:single-stranded DNA-binding protein